MTPQNALAAVAAGWRSRRRERDESGAVAVLVAVISIVMFVFAALVVPKFLVPKLVAASTAALKSGVRPLR